jgi:hypothetical protein
MKKLSTKLRRHSNNNIQANMDIDLSMYTGSNTQFKISGLSKNSVKIKR